MSQEFQGSAETKFQDKKFANHFQDGSASLQPSFGDAEVVWVKGSLNENY